MYQIKKITSHPTVDFAAEELKKYLRMMMPEEGEIFITREQDATEGFCLGLMQDFGLDLSEADDVELDDIVHVDVDGSELNKTVHSVCGLRGDVKLTLQKLLALVNADEKPEWMAAVEAFRAEEEGFLITERALPPAERF